MKSILTLLSLFLCTQLQAETSSLDKIVTDSIAFWRVTGCTVSIVRGDEIVLCKGYGVKQVNGKTDNAIDTHTRFPIASLTKSFTASAFGILLDRGMVTLDTPVQKIYPLKLSDSYAASHLTFRDCLSMRSGLPGPSTFELVFSDPHITRKQLLEKILPSIPLPLGFRSHFSYQNLLYLLAATPLAPSYENFIQKELLKPLEMSETLTSFSALQKTSNRAYPHVWKQDHFEQILYENLDAFLPAMGLSSSAHDMTHYLFFLLNQGTYHEKKILSPATQTEIFTPQTTATVAEFIGASSWQNILFPTAQFINYGLGCFINDYRGIKMIQVPGLCDGFVSILAIVPSLNLGIFISANSESIYFTHALLFQCIDAFLEQKTDWNVLFHKHLLEQ